MYAWLKCVSDITPKLMCVIGANIAGNLRAGVTRLNHTDFYASSEFEPPQYCYDRTWHKIRTVRSLPKSRITQYHHTYVNWQELFTIYDNIKPDSILNKHRLAAASYFCDNWRRLGFDNRVSALTMLTYIATAPQFAVQHIVRIMSQAKDEADFAATLKFEGGAAKQLQHVFRSDLAAVYELQVLKNRVYDVVNWHKEIDNRMRPKTVPVPTDLVFREAVKIFRAASAEGRKPRPIKWNEYWALRWSHMPTGSVVSQYEEDLRLKKNLPQDARVKAAWYSACPMHDHKQWLQRDPQIYATTSTKYEWGKVRALYGCDVTSFLHSDFAMGDCEELMPSCFPIGQRANERYVRKIISTFSDGVPLCYDFDDFNSQHSTESMIAVIRAWQTVFGNMLSDEQRQSLEWTARSVAEQYVSYTDLKVKHRINGTLLSGWRLTSFINSVLNRVYLACSGVEQLTNYALHNGDDVFSTTKNVHNAMELIRRSKALGVRAQVSKTNIGTIGEFLRIDTRAESPTGAQYLTRAVSTAVHGRIETAPPNDLREVVSSFVERYGAIEKRGGDPSTAARLLSASLRFIRSLFDVEQDVIEALQHLHPIQGGGNRAADVGPWRLETVVRKRHEVGIEAFSPIRRGIDDYANAIVKRFGLRFDMPDRMQMFRSAVSTLNRPMIAYELVPETDQMIQVYRGLYKAWSNSKFVTAAAMVRSLGYISAKQLPGLNEAVARMIRNSNDPIRLMSIML